MKHGSCRDVCADALDGYPHACVTIMYIMYVCVLLCLRVLLLQEWKRRITSLASGWETMSNNAAASTPSTQSTMSQVNE